MHAAGLRSLARQGWLTAAAVFGAILLGGGGSPAPFPEILLQVLVALLALAWWLSGDDDNPRAVPRVAILLAGLMISVPLVQLIPLPPGIWHALPGRETAREALALVERKNEWRALSLAPARTLAALLAVIPAALVLVMVAASGRAARFRVAGALALGGLATVLVGAAQVSQGAGGAMRFYIPDSAALDGFQANHNSTADVLLIALVAAIVVVRDAALHGGSLPNRRSVVLSLSGAIALVLSIAVILTASRTGIVLLPLALIACAVLLKPWLGLTRRTAAISVVAAALAASLAVIGATRIQVFDRVEARFALGRDMRPDLWRDSLFTAQQAFPVGYGMGNLVPALLAGERLEVVRETMPNRAHNEILELAVEAGAIGLIVWGVIAAALVTAAHRARAVAPANARALALAGAACLALLALHSLVDYPFRSMSLAIAGAACAGFLLPPRGSGFRAVRSIKGNEER